MNGDLIDFSTEGMVGAPVAWMWMVFFALALGLPIALIARRWLRERGNERAARGDLDEVGVLAPGRRVRVAGEVEFARGASKAVRMELTLAGAESRTSEGDVYRHVWAERAREIHAEPFYIRLHDGARVRVEPGEGAPVIVDALDRRGPPPDELAQMGGRAGVVAIDVAVAELTPGERVVATGTLERGRDPEAPSGAYRGGDTGWVLRPPDDAALELMTESSLAAHRESRRVFGGVVWLFVLAALLAQGPFASFVAREVFGAPRVAVVEHTHLEHTRPDRSTPTHYTLARCEDGSCEIDANSGDRFIARGSRIWVHTGPLGTIFGRDNRWQAFWLIGQFLLLVVALTGCAVLLPRKHWWQKRRFVDVGAGRIPRAATREKEAAAVEEREEP